MKKRQVTVSEANRSQITQLIFDTKCVSLDDAQAEILQNCLMLSSSIWVGMLDGELVCVWGLAPPTIMSDQAYLWLYTTENLKSHEFLFVRHSQRAVEEMLESFPRIVGHTVAGAEKTIRWLRWLGAKFSEAEGQLIPFTIRAKHG